MAEPSIKRIYEPASRTDGARILVDRIWPRGVSKEDADLAEWLKQIAPSAALRRWFNHDPARFEEFRRRYWHELDANEEAVAHLLERMKDGPVTLLYGARDENHNQAVVLADYLHAAGGKHRRTASCGK